MTARRILAVVVFPATLLLAHGAPEAAAQRAKGYQLERMANHDVICLRNELPAQARHVAPSAPVSTPPVAAPRSEGTTDDRAGFAKVAPNHRWYWLVTTRWRFLTHLGSSKQDATP